MSILKKERKKERKEFSFCSSSQKYSYWNPEGAHSLERLGDQRE